MFETIKIREKNNTSSLFKYKNNRVKNVQIQSFILSVFRSPYSIQMRGNTEQRNSITGHYSRSE